MNTLRAAASVAPLLLLSACTVGPDHAPPPASALTPATWSNDSTAAATADITADITANITDWWTRLGDDQLTDLIERSFDSNPGLAEARERVISARARRGIENADRMPTLDAQASYTRLQTGDEAFNPGGTPAGSEADIYALGAVAGWELDLWGRVDRLTEAADAEIEAAAEDLRASRVALAAEVARELVIIRVLDREIDLVQATITTDQDALDIARARADAGFADDLDAARAERDLQANRALIPGLRADRRESEFRLAVLLGSPPGSVAVAPANLPEPTAPPALGVPADLLLRRPDLRRAERELAAATARIGAARAERFPRVSLSGSIALQGPDLGDAVNTDAYVLSAGPSISLPIFEGGRIRSRVLQAESQQRQALIRLQSAVLDALNEVETAAMRHANAQTRAAHLRDAQRAAQQAEDFASARFAAGQSDFLNVTETRRSRLGIERTRLAAERDTLLRLIDLYAALGGGWPAPPEPIAATP